MCPQKKGKFEHRRVRGRQSETMESTTTNEAAVGHRERGKKPGPESSSQPAEGTSPAHLDLGFLPPELGDNQFLLVICCEAAPANSYHPAPTGLCHLLSHFCAGPPPLAPPSTLHSGQHGLFEIRSPLSLELVSDFPLLCGHPPLLFLTPS